MIRPAPDFAVVDAAKRTLDGLARLAASGDRAAFRDLLWGRADHVRTYLASFQLQDAGEDMTETYVNDALGRFLLTLELVPLPPPRRILEIGSNPYFFHLLLAKLFPSSELSGTNFFERNAFSTAVSSLTQRIASEAFAETHDFGSILFSLETVDPYPLPAEAFDLVFFCETLEHLVVDPLPVFARLRRVVSPGGRLVVTLPNAARLTNLALILAGRNVYDVYRPEFGIHGRHNRDFTLEELVALVRQNGFAVETAVTADRHDYERVPIGAFDYTGESRALPWRKSDLVRHLKRAGGRLESRGDNLYVVARKPFPGGSTDDAETVQTDGADARGVLRSLRSLFRRER